MPAHVGYDSHAYWHAWEQQLYRQDPDVHFDRYLYPPIFAQLIWPLTLLPWSVFVTVWSAMTAGVFLWLLWPLRLRWRVPLFVVLCLHEALVGNVNALLAAMLVLGFRYPGLWAFAFLTKVAPGIGLLWFALRREWRPLGIAVVTTGVLVGASLLTSFALWRQWLDLVTSGTVETQSLIPYWLQLVLGIGVISYAALQDRAWLLPVGVFLLSPVASLLTLSLLAAIPRLTSGTRDAARDREPADVVRTS